ncbi:MAG: ABC transporter permease, partial [Gammaproteobacteria bacterium]
MRLGLAFYLALKGIRFHRGVALITVLGVAIGMLVISTILIVDHNTSRSESIRDARETARMERVRERPAAAGLPDIRELRFERASGDQTRIGLVPAQEGSETRVEPSAEATDRIGEADYQAMRLAVRLASVFAFTIGAVIVFYTMRFSLASRRREFALLLTLGEHRETAALALAIEAVVLGFAGLLLGSLAAIPTAMALLERGVTTTGRSFVAGFHLPWLELGAVSSIGILVALAGVAGPALHLWRLSIRDVLQPRFVAGENELEAGQRGGYGWILVPVLAMAYVMMRPFLKDWLTVVVFFLVESAFVVLFALAVLIWVRPVLKALIRAFEWILGPALPLETLLSGRRMRLALRQFTFTIISVVVVFSLVTALQGIATSLKMEIHHWAWDALIPNVHYSRVHGLDEPLPEKLLEEMADEGVYFYRVSPKGLGALPMRLVKADDLNRLRAADGRPEFGPGQVILSSTLAARYRLEPGDSLVLEGPNESHRFEVLEVSDRYGYYPVREQYVDMRTYALFTDGNPLFRNNMEKRLGDLAIARAAGDDTEPSRAQILRVAPQYQAQWRAGWLGWRQQQEIDRD